MKGERIGVDARPMEANAALRNIVPGLRTRAVPRYRGMLARLAQESGIETPVGRGPGSAWTASASGKKLSNQDWVSKSDPEAKIAKMKDVPTHLAYKPEHAVDLDTGLRWWPPSYTRPTRATRRRWSLDAAAAKENLEAPDAAPTAEDPAECVTDKGYRLTVRS